LGADSKESNLAGCRIEQPAQDPIIYIDVWILWTFDGLAVRTLAGRPPFRGPDCIELESAHIV